MAWHEIFFYAAVMFLVGVALASFQLSVLALTVIVVAVMAVGGVLGMARSKWWMSLAVLAVFILAGVFYYQWQDQRYGDYRITFNQPIKFSGWVASDSERRLEYQLFQLELNEPSRGRLLVRADLFPEYRYGDRLRIEGEVEPPPPDYYGAYLAKEGVQGTVNFAAIEKVGGGGGSRIRALLLTLKNNSVAAFQKLLTVQQAAFLAGITFGEQGEFSPEFLDKLSASGTRHLIALSGSNLSIVVFVISGALGWALSRKKCFIITFIFVVLFVAMTGLEASAIRAAFMAFVIALASNIERIYSPRNSIALAGLVLVLFNPRVLVFDVGFQLSFLAIVGIVYLAPALEQQILTYEVNIKNSFWGWREILMMTVAAQLMTAPLLITQFNNFTLIALLTNVLILPVVPALMIVGFFIGITYYLFVPAAFLLGQLAALLIDYEVWVIEFFSQWPLAFNPTLTWPVIAVYYGVLFWFICSRLRKTMFI